eukprot:CAMPEP_0117441790 /NCGR_PEP_ID=MMETSP0759-20121206/3814_1 /TAXON_ID=63605 /ORGANISM="Percolomonas cosmopolitus, Strain WS" /LENGTH=687 /DNA_ID=CAMNT_0005233651 /DNA_START=312 /DNA_END=2375 /DNA_ORIENTATION=+
MNLSTSEASSDLKWKVGLILDSRGERSGIGPFLEGRGMFGGPENESEEQHHEETEIPSDSLTLDSGLVVMISMKSKDWQDYCPTLFGLTMDENILYVREKWEREMRENREHSEHEGTEESNAEHDEMRQQEDSEERSSPDASLADKQNLDESEDADNASTQLLSEEQIQNLPSFINRIVYVHSQVSTFLINGADLMAPGIAQYVDIKSTKDQQQFVNRKREEINSQKKKHDFLNRSDQTWCLVFVIGNNFPIAVGKWVARNNNLSSGVAVEILHRYGDAIWEHGRQQGVKDPPGFKRTIVEPVDYEDGNPGDDTDAECADEDSHTPSEQQHTEEQLEPLTQHEQDNILQQLFFVTLKQTADSEFPLDSAILYTKMLHHPWNVQSQANIKASSWRKLAKFMKDMNKEKIVKGKLQKNVFTIHSVNRSHPAFQTISDSAPTVETIQPQSKSQKSQQKKMTIVQLYKFPSNMRYLLKGEQHETPIHGNLFTGAQVSQIVSDYLEPHRKGKFIQIPEELHPQLVTAYKAFSKRVAKAKRKGLPGQKRDGLLKNCPDPDQANQMETRFVKVLVEEGLTPYHGIQYDEDSPMKITSGSPKCIEVQVSKIMGNKLITKVTNLSLFNIPYQTSAFHTQLQKKMSSSVKTDPEDKWEVSIQGAQSDQFIKFLEKEWGFDSKFIRVENLVKGGKKKK